MKVIELLNKIANKEEIPNKIKYDGEPYKFENVGYYNIYSGASILRKIMLDSFYLLKEIEVIEEDKGNKIRGIKVEYSSDIEEKIFYEDGDKPRHCVLGDAGTELLINKINEIIDKITKLETK